MSRYQIHCGCTLISSMMIINIIYVGLDDNHNAHAMQACAFGTTRQCAPILPSIKRRGCASEVDVLVVIVLSLHGHFLTQIWIFNCSCKITSSKCIIFIIIITFMNIILSKCRTYELQCPRKPIGVPF